jgi:uroporphyrinogen-III decarboxylase
MSKLHITKRIKTIGFDMIFSIRVADFFINEGKPFLSNEQYNEITIMSDVSASLFSIGSEQQVEDYVKKLIDKLGVDGGHILASGCEVPPNIRPENFRTFLKTGKTYQLSK